MKAREAAPVLRAAHEADCVDTMVNGDWDAVCDLLDLYDEDDTSDPGAMEIEEILSQLEVPGDVFPRAAVEAAVANREEITPRLLEILKKDPAELAERDEYFGQFFAMYLLAQFREQRALPTIVELFSGPADVVAEMAGDFAADGLDRILASVASGDAGPVKRLVENREANEWARGSAVKALVTMAASGQLSRGEVVGYLEHLFGGGLEREFSNTWNVLVSAATDIHAEELRVQIDQAFEDELVEEFFIDREYVEEHLAAPPGEDPLAGLDRRRYRLVDDTIEEMHWWAAFRPEGAPSERTPLPSPGGFGVAPGYDFATAPSRSGKSGRARKKAKNKRKASKASKRKNRR